MLRVCLPDPIEEDRLVGVRGEPVDGPDVGGDGDLLAEGPDLFGAVDDPSSEGADGLVADEKDAGVLVPQVVAEMERDVQISFRAARAKIPYLGEAT